MEAFSRQIKDLIDNVATLWVAIGSKMTTNEEESKFGSLFQNKFLCPELKYVARSTASIAQFSLELAKTEKLAILKLVNDIDIYDTNINKGMVYNIKEVEESPLAALETALEFVPWNETALIFLQGVPKSFADCCIKSLQSGVHLKAHGFIFTNYRNFHR